MRTGGQVTEEGEERGGGGDEAAGDGDDSTELVLDIGLRHLHQLVTEGNEADRGGKPSATIK